MRPQVASLKVHAPYRRQTDLAINHCPRECNAPEVIVVHKELSAFIRWDCKCPEQARRTFIIQASLRSAFHAFLRCLMRNTLPNLGFCLRSCAEHTPRIDARRDCPQESINSVENRDGQKISGPRLVRGTPRTWRPLARHAAPADGWATRSRAQGWLHASSLMLALGNSRRARKALCLESRALELAPCSTMPFKARGIYCLPRCSALSPPRPSPRHPPPLSYALIEHGRVLLALPSPP